MRTRDRLPPFLINPERSRKDVHALKKRLRAAGLHTVCESARCPNIIECFKRPTAAFMVLGDRCSRRCGFCAVERGAPPAVDPAEPEAVAEASAELGLSHVVVTSVTRDDLPDGGAGHFAAVIRALKDRLPRAAVEVLVPDFKGEREAVETVMAAGPDVFNHNLETVERLYPVVRPGADYGRSLMVLEAAAEISRAKRSGTLIKSGLMVGLGEDAAEVKKSISELSAAGCGLVTVGQYLQPKRDRLPVSRYWEPEEYENLVGHGRELGIRVFAGPLVRSSYLADEAFAGVSDRLSPSCSGGDRGMML